MEKNKENEITVELGRIEKKEYQAPQITELDVKETMGGSFEGRFETTSYYDRNATS